MLFAFGPRSGLLLPFVLPGLAATIWLLGRAGRRGAAPDALLALLVLLPTLSVAQWMLGYAGWYDSHDGYSTLMFYVPWQLSLALGPAYYLYFRSLANQAFDWREGRHLLPALAQAGLWLGAAAYDLLWYQGWQHRPLPAHFGTKGVVAQALDALQTPLAWVGHALLLAYGLRTLASFRRYRRYLNDHFSDPEQLRFAGLRQLLLLQLAVLALNLTFSAAGTVYDFSYDSAWYFYALQGCLIYGLIAVGLQANYASASHPLRFEAAAPEAAASRPAPSAAEDELPALPPCAPAGGPGFALPAAADLPPALLPLRDRLLAAMRDEQPWLEPELSLTELAHRLKAGPAQLSRVINTGCGQNFNDFVNGYRVQAAAARLADPQFAHYSLLGVALDCGFNSKSTFNRVFKKLAGHPPSEVERPKL